MGVWEKEKKQNVSKPSVNKLNQSLIRQLADNRENEQRDEEATKKYVTQDEKESQSYERGFKNGWQAAKDKFWALGFDEGLRQAAKERKEESD